MAEKISLVRDDFDKQSLKDLNWQRFQLEHINNKMMFIMLTSRHDATNAGIVVDSQELDDLRRHLGDSREGVLAQIKKIESYEKVA